MCSLDYAGAFCQITEVMPRYGIFAAVRKMIVIKFENIKDKAVAEIYLIHIVSPQNSGEYYLILSSIAY